LRTARRQQRRAGVGSCWPCGARRLRRRALRSVCAAHTGLCRPPPFPAPMPEHGGDGPTQTLRPRQQLRWVAWAATSGGSGGAGLPGCAGFGWRPRVTWRSSTR
jgi:hypothetical protein